MAIFNGYVSLREGNSMIPRLQLYPCIENYGSSFGAKGQLSKRNNAALVLGPNFTPLSKTSKFITPQPVTKGAQAQFTEKQLRYKFQTPQIWSANSRQAKSTVDSWFLHKPQWRSCLFIVPIVVGCVQVRV